MFPEPPPPELAPSCAEAGVLGVLCGIIGSLEAVEAVKMLLGIGEPLVGRFLAYDALAEEFRQFKSAATPTVLPVVTGQNRARGVRPVLHAARDAPRYTVLRVTERCGPGAIEDQECE